MSCGLTAYHHQVYTTPREGARRELIDHKSKARGSGLFWRAPEYLKAIRENLSLSQQDLAKNSGTSRSIIADIESGRTLFSSVQHALRLYTTLEALGSAEARRALLSIIALVREATEQELNGIELEMALLRKRQDARIVQLKEINSEEMRLRKVP
jgi:transcriptional regulator with XRE-family HTH domain